jgi:very-short-patch-repair endonuclease
MTAQQSRKKDTRVARARTLRRAMTDAERKLWWHLRRIQTGTTHFRRQATIGPYFADFASHERRVIVEVDGGQHGNARHVGSDASTTDYFAAHGYRVLRFWNNDVLSNIEGVLGVISAAVKESLDGDPPPLTPPHRATHGGRGTERTRGAANNWEKP